MQYTHTCAIIRLIKRVILLARAIYGLYPCGIGYVISKLLATTSERLMDLQRNYIRVCFFFFYLECFIRRRKNHVLLEFKRGGTDDATGRESRDLLVFFPTVDRPVFRPTVHLEMSQLRLRAPVEQRFRRLGPDDRIVRIVRIGVRPPLHRPQPFHQAEHAVSLGTRHLQLLRGHQIERAKSIRF